MNKDAKRMRNNYGVSYQTALTLIRKYGLDGALEVVSKTRGREDEPKAEPPDDEKP